MSVIRCGYTERLERVLPSAAEELERLKEDGGHEAIARS